MDPNENLRRQRDMVEITLRNQEGYVDPGDALELIQLMADLDEWLTKGGFLPAEWGKAQQFGTLPPAYALVNPKDKYGNTWPNVRADDRCMECGQPDNCGDCPHERLTDPQVRTLGGRCES